MKDEKSRIKEDKKRTKEPTKNRAEISRRARMTGKEIAVFREPPHFGAEFVLNDGTCVPLAVCRTGYRGEWEKSIGRVNALLEGRQTVD